MPGTASVHIKYAVNIVDISSCKQGMKQQCYFINRPGYHSKNSKNFKKFDRFRIRISRLDKLKYYLSHLAWPVILRLCLYAL